jgi:sec-independent protein translocase protein TatC
MQTGFLFAFILGIPIITLFVLNYLEVKFKLIQTIIYSYIGIAILGSIGAYIGIVHIAPILLQYLINLRPFALYWNVLSTMSFIYLIGISFALILQLIIVIPLLHITQTIHTAKIKAYRKHYIVGILIISGIITPPDPLSLILIAIPLILSIELGLAISYMCPQMTAIHTGRKQEC